MIHKFMFL